MKIHSDKTKCMIISSRQKLKTSSKQSLDLALSCGCKIKQVHSEKCLGVYMDRHMAWSTHIEKLCKKLRKRIALLARVHKFLPIQYRLLIYNASIRPLFEYCSCVWSNCSSGYLDDLFKLQKRCARYMIDQCPENTRSLTIFKQLGWIPVDKLCLLNKLILFKKLIDGRAPDYLCDKLTLFSSSSSKFNTRSRCLYR